MVGVLVLCVGGIVGLAAGQADPDVRATAFLAATDAGIFLFISCDTAELTLPPLFFCSAFFVLISCTPS